MQLQEIGKTNISDASPAGENAKYDDNYVKLDAEIEKFSSLSGGFDVDYQFIVKLSTQILEERSKDLFCAVYLSLGLTNTQGVKGFAISVTVLNDMVRTFWETMFPPVKRIRARTNAIYWWLEKLEHAVNKADNATFTQVEYDALFEELGEMENFLKEHISDAPIFMSLINAVNAKISVAKDETQAEPEVTTAEPTPQESETPLPQEPASQQEPSSEPKTEERAKPQSVQAPLPTPTEVTLDDETLQSPKALQEMFAQTLSSNSAVASALIQNHTYNPYFFMITRANAWYKLDTLPDNEQGKTMLNAPDAYIVDILTSLNNKMAWDELIWEAESRIEQFPCWLDLHFFVATALENLGEKSTAALVKITVLNYLNTFSGLENLTFNDDTPFASPETHDWIQQGTQGSNSSGSVGRIDEAEKQELVKKANTLLKSNKAKEAIDLFVNKINGAHGINKKIKWRVSFCNFLIGKQYNELLYNTVDALLKESEKNNITSINPDLASEVYEVAIKTYSNDESMNEHLESCKKMLATLDPSKFIRYFK